MRGLLFTNAPQPEQPFTSMHVALLAHTRVRLKTIQSNAVRYHSGQRGQIGKAACLRPRNTAEADVCRDIVKAPRRLKAARQMKRGQHGRADLRGPPPEA